MPQLILSICIPTYNRVDALEYLLKNIIFQLDENNLWDYVQICISDNASVDGTDTMVARYKERYEGIIYSRNHENIGFDRNLLQSVSLASGKYCWLFGSDDRFEAHAIETVVNYLKRYTETIGLTVNVQNYNPDFTQKIKNPEFRSKTDFVVNKASDAYIKLGCYFSFISAQIIKKKVWDDIILTTNVAKYCSGYIHLYIIANIVKNNPKWVYLSGLMVGWRSGNDSALEVNVDGYIRRLRLDYAYFDIARTVFGGQSWVYFCHGNQVCGQFIFANLQNMKINGNVNILPLFGEVTSRCWVFPLYYIKILPLFLIPASGLSFLKKLKHAVKI